MATRVLTALLIRVPHHYEHTVERCVRAVGRQVVAAHRGWTRGKPQPTGRTPVRSVVPYPPLHGRAHALLTFREHATGWASRQLRPGQGKAAASSSGPTTSTDSVIEVYVGGS